MVRGSLGRAIDLDATELREAYGFYAIPVQTFLALDAWVPHQTLLAEGKLVEVKAGDSDAEVIFCSHQWTSFDHPDPANEQLKALQSVLTNLMAGKTDVVSKQPPAERRQHAWRRRCSAGPARCTLMPCRFWRSFH